MGVSIYDQIQQLMRASPSALIIFYIFMGSESFFYTLAYVKEKIKLLLIHNIDDQNTTFVFAYKVTQVAELIKKCHQHQGIQPTQKVHWRMS